MEVLAVSAIVFLASAFGVATGFGTSTILFPFLLLFFPFQQMLLFVGVLHLATDVWKVSLFREGIQKHLILLFGLSGAFAAIIGAQLSFAVSEEVVSRFLGIALIGYAVFVFRYPHWQLARSAKAEIVGGVTSGLLAGLFGVGGPTRSAVLAAYNLPKASYIATAGAIAIFIDIPRLAVYLFEGTRLPANLLWGLLLYIPITYAGALVARRFLTDIPEPQFRRFVLGVLALLGLKLLFFP